MSKFRILGKTYFTGKPCHIIFKKSKHKIFKHPLRKYMRESQYVKELNILI